MPPAKPPISAADLVVSILALVMTVVGGVVAAAMGVFMLAFLDSCPPATCSAETAVTAIFASLAAALVVGIAGSVVTIVRLVRRKPAWPVAVGTMVVCGVLCFLGVAGYIAAVGG